MEKLFTDYYEQNLWGDPESASGPGSTIAHTEGTRQYISHILSTLGIKTMLDAPCGDYNWMRFTKRDGVSYIGGDIVARMIGINRIAYGDQHTKFVQMDITKDPLPDVDLMMVRDCLMHFSNEDIFKFLDNFSKSNIKYLLTTTGDTRLNHNIVTGDFKLHNLQEPPFSFPAPMMVFEEWVGVGQPKKKLALWRKEDFQKGLLKDVIPKRIFTLWISKPGKDIPKLMKRCMESQKLPGYEHRPITMDNYYRGSAYVNEAMDVFAKTGETKWLVKASDWLRMWYLYNEGGIYVDADVEMLPGMNFDDMLAKRMFVEQEAGGIISNALVGAEPKHPFIKEYLRRVETNFRGSGDMVFDPGIRAFADLMWITDKKLNGIDILDFHKLFGYVDQNGKICVGPETKAYHHFAGTWYVNPKMNKVGTSYEDLTLQEVLDNK